jgi:hypothetical protein
MSGQRSDTFYRRKVDYYRALDDPDHAAEWKKLCKYLVQRKCVVEDLAIWFSFQGSYRPDEFDDSITAAMSDLGKVLRKNGSISRLNIHCAPIIVMENCLAPAIMALKFNKSVEELNIAGPHLSWGGPAIEALRSVLKRTKTLKVLSLSLECAVFHHTNTAIDNFSRGLERNASLKEVTLWLAKPTAREVDRLSVALQKNKTVESYKLYCNDRNRSQQVELTSIMRAVENSACVKNLDISCFSYCRYCPGSILALLEHNNVLKHLQLCISSDEDLRGLAKGLMVNSSLQYLSVGLTKHMKLPLVDTFRIILEGLANGTSGLKSLHIDIRQEMVQNAPGQATFSKVRTLLQSCRTLESLTIEKDDDDRFSCDDVFAILSQVLREGSSSIKALGLFGNWNEGVLAEIASLLSAERSSLKSLKLCAIELGQDEFDAILRAERNNASLEELTIVNEEVSPLEEYNIGELLKTLKETACLRKLILNRLRISNSGASDLTNILQNGNSSLETLSLIDCKLNDDALIEFAQMLPNNSSLKYIDLNSNDFGERGVRALVAGLEKNTSVEEFSGIPDDFPVEWKQAEYYTMLNKARRKSYLEADDMKDDGWLKALGGFDRARQPQHGLLCCQGQA